MRGLKQVRSAALITVGHAFVQNLRRGHYDLAIDAVPPHSPSSHRPCDGCFLHTHACP
jgi:hypothetical protein